jgi:predicted PurR-regulated permease PerM
MFNEPMNSRRMFFGLVSVVAAVTILYFGREILLPLAIAILLTFLLSPVCTWLERRGMWRVMAVLFTLCSVTAVFAVVGWVVGLQMVDLATKLPEYKDNLIAKLQVIKPTSGGTLEKLRTTVDEVSGAIKGEEKTKGKGDGDPAAEPSDGDGVADEAASPAMDSAATTPGANRPSPSLDRIPSLGEGVERLAEQSDSVLAVRVVPDDAVPFDTLRTIVTTVAAPTASLAIIFVLVIFMLLNREDLRNRMVRLAGNRLALTTRTLDEVGTRISRYLLMNGLVNGGFGLCVAIGLKVIGVDYALTWGLLAAVLRFIPYIGPIVAAVLPISMAFIQFPANDWVHPLAALGLFIVLELICNNIIEPLAYGHGTGVSTVAILISALFWSWVWGPIGLMLSVPITVVLAVLGNHVPLFEPLGIILGDRPALASWISYYQRLLAGDVDEAESILQEQRKSLPLETVYDEVIVRALVLAEKDHDAGELTEVQRKFVLNSTRELVEELGEAAKDGGMVVSQKAPKQERAGSGEDDQPALRIDPPHEPSTDLHSIVALGCCVNDEGDEVCLLMLQQLMDDRLAAFEYVSAGSLTTDIVGRVKETKPDIVVISSLAPNGGAETRYLCKRLRKHFPDLKVVVGRWGCTSEKREVAERLKASGADATAVTLVEGRETIQKLADAIANEVVVTTPRVVASA